MKPNRARGTRHPRWRPEGVYHSAGYRLVRVGKGHPLADRNGYAYEHRLVLAAAGIEIPPGHEVHHKNEDRLDNRLGNLELRPKGAHSSLHARKQKRDRSGRFVGVSA